MVYPVANDIGGQGPVESLARVARAVRLAFRRRAVYRATLAELSAMSDREMADLDISPAMIRQLAEQAAYGG